MVRALSCLRNSWIGPSVATLGRTDWLARDPGRLLGLRAQSLVHAWVLQVSLLLGHLRLVVVGALRLVDVLIDPILRDRALPAVTHALMHRTSHASTRWWGAKSPGRRGWST